MLYYYIKLKLPSGRIQICSLSGNQRTMGSYLNSNFCIGAETFVSYNKWEARERVNIL